MNQDNIFDKDRIREQVTKVLESLSDTERQSIFNEQTEGTPEQKLHAYALNIFAEGYRAGAKALRGIMFSELNAISTYLNKTDSFLTLLHFRYFWRDCEALRNDTNAVHDYTSYYPDIQMLIDVTIDMQGIVDKRLEVGYERDISRSVRLEWRNNKAIEGTPLLEFLFLRL